MASDNDSKLAELAELHVHLGSSVDPATMWEIAHAQGIRLPTKDYWQFADMITVDKNSRKSFDEYLELFHWTDFIQSSPIAVERAVYQTIAGAYRKNNITKLELRFNPMKRNRNGEQDLDHIFMAAIRGLDRATLDYPVKAGIIVCLDRKFEHKLNSILVKKAIKYSSRGVVGIDIAGERNPEFRYEDYKALYAEAGGAGLGLTVHAGEEEDHSSVSRVVENLSPDRIGHGVKAAESEDVMDLLAKHGIVLELCPTSNLHTGVVSGIDHLKRIFKAFNSHNVKYTINTDGPEMLKTNLRNEISFLIENGIISEKDAASANALAFSSSFIK